jgi:hypothetical protein
VKTNRRSDRAVCIGAGYVLGISLFLLPARLSAQRDDHTIANRTFSYAFEHKLVTRPMGSIASAVGKYFAGNPYEEHTLDRSAEELLVVNLRSFDCVTFVENVLALSRAIKGNRLTFVSYQEELEAIRYRNGQRNGYGSRLHYFSEWIFDNAKKGFVRDLTDSLGGYRYYKPVNFLSQYLPLSGKMVPDSILAQIRRTEQRLTADSLRMIPSGAVRAAAEKINDGDIIAFVTAASGLDVGHTGFAVRDRYGVVHLLHASETTRRVELTRESLYEYLRKHPRDAGIMVARPLPPGE